MAPPSLEMARQEMMNKISLESNQSKLNELSVTLNTIVRDQSFETSKIKDALLARLPQVVEKGANEGTSNLQITQNLKVYTPESRAAWQNYTSLANQYKQAVAAGIDTIALQKKVDAAKTAALSLQGSLNSLSGQAFESLLQVLLPLVKDNSAELASTTVQNLVKAVESQSVLATSGAQHSGIQLSLDGKLVKISSPGKIDVNTSSPFLGDDDLMRISAKNYSSLRDIHLLAGASAVGLISQWPTQANKDYYYTALGYGKEMVHFTEAKMLFNIQALAGRGEGELANILILNVRSRLNPISVISIRSLLDNIENNPIAHTEAFSTKINSIPQFGENEYPSVEEFANRVQTITVDTTLNKAYLALSYLRKMG